MDATGTDDKIQAVVGLVLQAVDQRLETVREQLVQVTHAIARNHADLSRRIDDCHQMYEALQTGGGAAPDPAAAQATGQLVQAANVLTDRVAFLEVRVNQYTDDRIAELAALIDRIGGVTSLSGVSPGSSPNPLVVNTVTPGNTVTVLAPASTRPAAPGPGAAGNNVAPAVARLAPLGGVEPAAAPVAPPVAPAAPPAAASGEQPIDIALLSAQMSERLAAAVDRALGALPAMSSSGTPSNKVGV